MLYFDTHAHYDWKEFDKDRNELFEEFKRELCGLVNIGINVESANKVIEYAKEYSYMYYSIGIHPMEIEKEISINSIEQIIKNELENKSSKLVAIGETGLDYHFDYPIELQKKYFIEQIKLANKYSLPIIIKDTDKYGVEFNNRLLYVKKNDVKEINKNNNTDKKNSSGIAVLNYHAFYDENNAEEKANCTTEICHSKKQFKSQLNLIKEKDMLTLQMKEVEMYIDGKVQLPKSVLITIDDGPKTKIAVDLLTEYKMYATIFLVTSWFDEKEYYKTDYIELHSHTHNMHDGGKCHGGQGGAIKCLPEEEIQKDLKQSREELNGSTVFCYPFYEYNDYSIKMLKQAGFTMAFIGESNNSDNLIHVGSDKFRLRRFVIVTYTTISDLNKYFDQIK